MVRITNIGLLILLSSIKLIAADWCYYGTSIYYCQMGQTCGYYYGDCRGLPTYAIALIVSGGIIILSACIRCCIYMNANNRRMPATVVVQRPIVRAQAPIHAFGNPNYMTTSPPMSAPVHAYREEAPPAYNAVVPQQLPQNKY